MSEPNVGGEGPPPAPRYASFARRMAAWLIDVLILSLLTGLYAALVGGSAAASLLAVAVALNGVTPEVEGAFKLGIALTVLAIVAGALVLHSLYWVLFTGLRGQTPGKMALGIRVVNAQGAPPGLLRAGMRELVGKPLAKLVCYVGYLWVLADRRNQGWHDKIADTYVIVIR